MEKNTSSGVSGATLLLILFIALKLIGVIHWSWWWVLAPCWVPLLLTFSFIMSGWYSYHIKESSFLLL